MIFINIIFCVLPDTIHIVQDVAQRAERLPKRSIT